jgi:hypothetical protein
MIFVVVGLFVFNFFGFVIAMFFVGFDLTQLLSIMENPLSGPETRVPLLIIQGVTGIGSFIIVPVLYQKYVDRSGNIRVEYEKNEDPANYLIMVLFTFTIMPLTAKLMEWNENLSFPASLSEIERSLRATHDFVEESTKHLVSLDGPFELILGLLVIAVVPAIGEEFLFRGFIQKYLIKGMKNVHLGIFVTGFLFGAFHMQIFVMLPRILLGIVYGYFYQYSRNLYMPMLAHFTNNAFMVTMLYLYNQGMIEFNIEDEENMPLMMVLTGLALSAMLFFYLKSKYDLKRQQG